MRIVQPIANGISTDHPHPGLSFVDDTHIPLDDPRQIEAVGRIPESGMWGRWDGPQNQPVKKVEWWAFTTDPIESRVAWCVRYHPEYGRTVVLVNAGDASSLHTQWSDVGGPLLFRAGGYWWDGTTWYRPAQVFDWASETFVRRKVASATTITAADVMLDGRPDPTRAAVIPMSTLHEFGDLGRDFTPLRVGHWHDHLALWASKRWLGARALTDCVVNISAPELAGDQLIGATELAELAGLGASTLRAYSARGEAELPDPQVVISGRAAYSKPVATDWIERRERSSDGITESMTGGGDRPVGVTDLRERYSAVFFERLWETPLRKRWSLRNKESVAHLADDLAGVVANDLDTIIPTEPLAITLRYAVLWEFTTAITLATELNDGTRPEHIDVTISWKVAKMFDWLVRHHPAMASLAIGDIVGEAERELHIPRHLSIRALRTALVLDGKLPDEAYEVFFDRAFPPEDE